jgi:hypothetical protein
MSNNIDAQFSAEADQLIEALVKFQAQVTPPAKNSKGHNYTYADMASVRQAIVKPLSDNGLVYTQPTRVDMDGDGNWRNVIITRVMHISGQWMQGEYIPALDNATGKGNVHWQDGTALSYGRRYALMGLLGLAAEDTDAARSTEVPKAYMDRYFELVQQASEVGVPSDQMPTLPEKPTSAQIETLAKQLKVMIKQMEAI